MQRSSYKRDARVPQGGEVLYRLTNSVLIVDPDIGDSRDIGSHVDEDQRNLTETKVLQQGFFHAEGEDRHPIHPAFDHAAHRRFHPFWIMHGRGQKDFVVVLDGEILEGLNDLREKWIGNFGNDQPQDAAPARNQSSRLGVGEVAEFVHHLPHPLGKLGIDGGNMVDRSGHGGSGNLRSPRDLTDIHGDLPGNHAPTKVHLTIAVRAARGRDAKFRKRLPRLAIALRRGG